MDSPHAGTVNLKEITAAHVARPSAGYSMPSDPIDGNGATPDFDATVETEATAELCRKMANGDAEARDSVFRFVYRELCLLAHRKMQDQPAGHTLQATALVHEAYLKLSGSGARIRDRGHLVAVCAQAMRQILVDHARKKAAGKRTPAGTADSAIDALLRHYEQSSIDFLSLDEALKQLAQKDPLAAQLVELRFVAGASVEDCATQLGIPVHQAYRRLRSARAYLHVKVEGNPAPE